jgi:flagellar biosynthesis/type III secretory pathway protein FliH
MYDALEWTMPQTRLNITLPTPMVDDIKALYGQRGLSQFLEEAAREKLAEVKRTAYKGLMEGYQATAEETVEVLKKFEATVTEERDV